MPESQNTPGGESRLDGRAHLVVYYAVVGLTHLMGWGAVALLAQKFPSMVGLGALAYGLGIRHAFDADHIAAIDNVTRTLVHSGKSPYGTGFFFSLGHSSIVFLIAAVLGITTNHFVSGLPHDVARLTRIGGFLGTGISGICLLAVGLLNCIILLDLYRSYRRGGNAGVGRPETSGGLPTGGLLFRLFGGLFRRITSAVQMYFVGFLFGLGFDTASEVALLAVSAGVSSSGTPLVAVMSLPTLFAAGMLLMDTSDAAFMTKAYRWASTGARRRWTYNITMTAISVVTAIAIGSVELVRLGAKIFGARETGSTLLGHADSWLVGVACVALFAIVWATIGFARRRRLS